MLLMSKCILASKIETNNTHVSTVCGAEYNNIILYVYAAACNATTHRFIDKHFTIDIFDAWIYCQTFGFRRFNSQS